jgi:hypothetical protein
VFTGSHTSSSHLPSGSFFLKKKANPVKKKNE